MNLKDFVGERRGRLKELAEELGIVPGLLSMWVNGTRKIPREWRLKIQRVTKGQVKADDLPSD